MYTHKCTQYTAHGHKLLSEQVKCTSINSPITNFYKFVSKFYPVQDRVTTDHDTLTYHCGLSFITICDPSFCSIQHPGISIKSSRCRGCTSITAVTLKNILEMFKLKLMVYLIYHCCKPLLFHFKYFSSFICTVVPYSTSDSCTLNCSEVTAVPCQETGVP